MPCPQPVLQPVRNRCYYLCATLAKKRLINNLPKVTQLFRGKQYLNLGLLNLKAGPTALCHCKQDHAIGKAAEMWAVSISRSSVHLKQNFKNITKNIGSRKIISIALQNRNRLRILSAGSPLTVQDCRVCVDSNPGLLMACYRQSYVPYMQSDFATP